MKVCMDQMYGGMMHQGLNRKSLLITVSLSYMMQGEYSITILIIV